MRNIAIPLLCLLFTLESLAQISHGGEPYQWNTEERVGYDYIQVPATNLARLKKEDLINDKIKDIPYRFGKNIEVDFDIHNSGSWTELENGDGIWRLAIRSKDAKSLNFVFDQYHLPEGARIFVYTEDKSQLIGSFTKANASKLNSLGVGLIFSDHIIIEYQEPADVRGQGYLHINNVTHGYRDILVEVESEAKGEFGDAGDCNINVNCPTDIDIDFQKRSVAIIVVGNAGICSGALVNNTQQDETPLFLTANHCLPANEENTQNWIFYFNHETPDCSGNTGPTNQSLTGGLVLASNDKSDFAILELNQSPPEFYNVCYSGWDATDSENSVSSAFGIHHPRGDVKKICFEEDSPYHLIRPFQSNNATEVWEIDQWEEGVTEPGSSGSPLFNQNGLIIGQLAGGQAACDGNVNNGSFDYYGRLGVSWSFGSTPSNSLRFYLDPSNSGTLIVPNSCNTNLPDLNASLGTVTGIPEILCELSSFSPSVNLVNFGIETIENAEFEVTFNGNSETIEWSGSIVPQSNAFIQIGEYNASNGMNNLSIEILTLNGQPDTDPLGNTLNKEFEAFEQSMPINVNIATDDFPGETTWQVQNEFTDTIATGGPYNTSDIVVNELICLVDGCYEFTIFDSAGDGICCGIFGDGFYTVTDDTGIILAEGGDFTFSETTSICAVLDTHSTADNPLVLFPNPATNLLKIDGGNAIIQSARIYDISGKLVAEKTGINSRRSFFQTNALPAGMYVVEVQDTGGKTQRQKIVVAKDD